tara:strand:+ start:458 stop:859 length:402 start_codon:yes stop_codon:yes gene_type:complete
MMTETELWYSLNGGLTANAIYMAGIFFLLWVAFRAANQMRAEDANVFNKTLVSLFSLGIIFNGLNVGAILIANLQGTAWGFAQLEEISAPAQLFVDTWYTGDAGSTSILNNPINVAWWLVITTMIFGRIWTKN